MINFHKKAKQSLIVALSLIFLSIPLLQLHGISTPVHAAIEEGTYGWTRTFGGAGGDEAKSVTVDSLGNVYVTGYFNGTVNFDDTGGTDSKGSNGSIDIFITKYNSDGSYGWTKTFGGTGGERAKSITVDSTGNLYLTGDFNGTANFDDTGGTDSKESKGGDDIFITKYNSDGSYAWTRAFGGTSHEMGRGISVDSIGDVYVIGSFLGTANFDGTGGTDSKVSKGSYDIFITKYKSNGSYAWTRTFGGTSYDWGNGISVDNMGNVYVTGEFLGTVNFDGTGGTDEKTSNGETDIFITKYNSNGSYGWTRTFGGASDDSGNSISVDNTGNVYVTGHFKETVNFDGTGGTDSKETKGGVDIFVTKYSSDGSYAWTRTFGGAANDMGYGISIDSIGNVYGTGCFYTTANFDGTGGTDNKESNGSTDIFITKYSNRKLYQVDNLNPSLRVTNASDQDISVGSGNGAVGLTDVYLKDSLGNIISVVETNMATDRDWSGVSGATDITNGKSVVSGLTSAPGTADTHTLYIPIPDITKADKVRICPQATSLEEVTLDCIDGVTFSNGETKTVLSNTVTVSKLQISGQWYWLADGVSGTGGMGMEQDITPPTGTVLINDNRASTNTREVVLSLSATDTLSGVSEMIISNTSDFAGAIWESFSTTKAWTLLAGSGEKTVYVKFRDNAGNESSVVSDTIELILDSEATRELPRTGPNVLLLSLISIVLILSSVVVLTKRRVISL